MPTFIVTNLSKLTEGNFTITVNNIINAMTDNPDFPTPKHPMATVLAMFILFKGISKDRHLMSPKDTKDRNKYRDALIKMVRENGVYIIGLYPDDEDKQISSAYPPVRTKNDSGEPDIPYGIKASNGENSGEASLYWKGSRIANSYIVKYRILGSTDSWQYKTVPKSRGVLIEGLTPGEKYEFWVKAVGTKKDSDYAGPAELRIL